MQVKKFEAKTMREALELVKINLGPDAIIIGAKENNRGFGIAGSTSIEVTAAISEAQLRKKQLAEAKLTKEAKERYSSSSAKIQKQFIDRVFEEKIPTAPSAALKVKRVATSRQYIDIDDEEEQDFVRRPTHFKGEEESNELIAKKRIQSATRNALKAFEDVTDKRAHTQKSMSSPVSKASQMEQFRIKELQDEILQLRKVIQSFSSMPQSFVSRHPGADEGIGYELSFLYKKLIESGVSVENTTKIVLKAQKEVPNKSWEKKPLVDAWAIRHMMGEIQLAEGISASRTHMFVGPSGHGKTASLVKFASHLSLKEGKKIAIVTYDNNKVGAAEQLKIFAQILNVPFIQIRNPVDWPIIEARFSNVDCFLVDTPGSNLRVVQEMDSIRSMIPKDRAKAKVHYVQSVLTKDSDAFEIASRYKVIGFDDVIFTRLDDSNQHGIIFNFHKKFETPLFAFGIGSQIPEDFEYATKERVMDLIFRLSRIKKERG